MRVLILTVLVISVILVKQKDQNEVACKYKTILHTHLGFVTTSLETRNIKIESKNIQYD